MDCPIPMYENVCSNMLDELWDMLKPDNVGEETLQTLRENFGSNVAFLDNGILFGGTVLVTKSCVSEEIQFQIFRTVTVGEELSLFLSKVYGHHSELKFLISRYCKLVEQWKEYAGECSYSLVERVLEFITAKENVGRTCKFEIPIKNRIPAYIKTFDMSNCNISITVKTAYYITFVVKTFFKDKYGQDSEMTVFTGETSMDNVETFIKELYYNGNIVNYGR